MSLVALASAWMVGIYVAAKSSLPLVFWGGAALWCLSVAWFWRRALRVRWAALCGLFLCLGGIRYQLALPQLDERSVATYNDSGWVTLSGVLVAEPDVRDTYANLRLRAESLSIDRETPRPVRGLVLVRVPRYPEHSYGERVEVNGLLETPPEMEGFSYRDYLARQGIYSVLRWAQVTVLARDEGSPLLRMLYTFRRHTQRSIGDLLPEPYAALLTGILVGVETGLPAALQADFSVTGTSHIIAISGFNMALISGVVSRLSVRAVGRRYAAWTATAAIALYTIFVGASAAVVRAAVMGAIGVWGEHFGRQRSAPHALFATALLMTAWNPHTLWDLGFLLSFAATWGLIALADPLQIRFQRFLSWWLPARWVEPVARTLDEALVLTTCAQVTTLPIILYSFRTLSLVTLLSNALILPVQQHVMIWGAAATLGGLLWLPVGRVLAWVAWLPLAWTVWAVEWTADLPRAAVELGRVAPAVLWIWYGLVGGGAWWMAQTEERRQALWAQFREALAVRGGLKALLAGMGIAVLLIWLAVWAQPDGKLHVTFLDVGQGDAVMVETPSGRQVLLDGGPSGTAMSAHVGQRLPFWDRTLDVVLLTALDRDHLDGLVPVLERYAVERLWYPLPGDELPSAAFEAMWAGATTHGAAIETMAAGMRVDLGDGVLITMLYPPGPGERKDGVSVVRLDYGATCFLFSGSADLAVEGEMVARGLDLRCDVLQVGRQGSEEASSVRFLEAVRPALAVISCGEGSYVPEPDAGTLERLAEGGATVARTDELGSIEVISDGVGYKVRVGR